MSIPHAAASRADQALVDTVPLVGLAPDGVAAGSRVRGALPWALAALPAAVGLVGAVVLTRNGSPLTVELTGPLAAAVAEVGVGVSLAVAYLWPWRRRRAAAATQTEYAQAVARDREVHAERVRLLLRLDHELKNPLQALRLTVASAPDDLAQALPAVAAQADRFVGAFVPPGGAGRPTVAYSV